MRDTIQSLCEYFLMTSSLMEEAFLKRNRGGDTPYNSLYGEAPPKRNILFRLQLYKRVGDLLPEVYERVKKSIISVCKKGPKG